MYTKFVYMKLCGNLAALLTRASKDNPCTLQSYAVI